MGNLKRKQIYLDEESDIALKSLAVATKVMGFVVPLFYPIQIPRKTMGSTLRLPRFWFLYK